jgi:serine/threonine protein kinase
MPELIRKIEPGDVIGRCRAIRELGRGGVGTVYLATHQTLQIDVALKVLSPTLSIDNPALAERFVLEAQLAARIRHPNVIAVMDAAHDDLTGLSYIVMEYVGGGALSWHLRHGPIPEAKALAIVTGIAQALAIAEENQIVHRDIKPDNIMLDLRGTPKLADLGLAKHIINSHTSLTLGGSFMGTPAYMSPEQARDAKVADTRDDIYSLGATFYECLTGQPPFQGETPYNIMSELLTKPSPKPRDARPEISRSADLICRKMMAKTRNLRYANARALLDDLQICQTHGDAGLDRLEAATFDSDAQQARQQAQAYGVETSADGVYVPEPPEDSETGPIQPPTPPQSAPRRTDYGAFAAAAFLIAFVAAAALALFWLGPRRPPASLTSAVTQTPEAPASPQVNPTPAPENTPPAPQPKPVEPASPVTTTVTPPTDVPPVIPKITPVPPAQPLVTPQPSPPVVYPVDPDMSNAVPALPVNPADLTQTPIPAWPQTADSAFADRTLAESSLDPGLIGPTGHADLLKILGHREDGQVSPPTWIFYFFDKAATGHARIVTVSQGKVVKNREDVANFVSPYSADNIMPEDKTLIDSTQALTIAESLAPGVTVSSSELVLSQQKDSVPMWRVTLWSKNGDDGERKLGDVTILAETGSPIRKKLEP